MQTRNATNQNAQMFWTNLRHSLDTNTYPHSHCAVVALGSIITEGRLKLAGQGNRFRSCPKVDHQQRLQRRAKTFNQNNFVPALLAFNYILNTHTDRHTCANNCQALLKCRCQFIRMKKWPTDSRPAALTQRGPGPRVVQEEEFSTRTILDPGSSSSRGSGTISVCHFQNVSAAASYHRHCHCRCPLRMTVLPMFHLLSFCFLMLLCSL